MGVRSRANEYYSDGSMALKREAFYGEESIRLKRRNSGRRAAKQQRILKGQRARLAVLGIAGGALIVILSAVSLKGLDQNSLLSAEISNLENQVESLTVYNDAREYEINNSIDLNEVIARATNELGMVRSNAAQIVYFSSKDSEFLQQVAAVPAD